MHRFHSGLTVAAPLIKNGSGLKALLKSLDTNQSGAVSVFDQSDTTLFASGVILPEQDYHGKLLPETFVFSTTFCGPRKQHIADLLNTNRDLLLQLFSYCHAFNPGDEENTTDQLLSFIRRHSHTGTFSSGCHLSTKKEVSLEKNLRDYIRDFIDHAQDTGQLEGRSPSSIKQFIVEKILSPGSSFEWARQPFQKNSRERLLNGWMHFLKIPGFICLFLLSPLLVYINFFKTPPAKRPDDRRVREVAATQLNPVINGMTAAAPLKKGKARRWFYATALKIIGWFSPVFVKVPTVSSIRWIVVNDKNRLLFQSNYSNTTDFYVRDFLNGKTPRGVNFMFSNGYGFPDATLSIFGGIRKYPEEYMNAVHSGQHAMDLWYVHEKTITIDIIQKNRQIRNGLPKQMNDQEAAAWLRLL